MNTELIQIKLTDAQVNAADWAMGLPIFCYDTAEQLAFDWDETPQRAAEIFSAAEQAKLDKKTWIIPNDPDIITYLHSDLLRLADMAAKEGFDEWVDKGFSERAARCKCNAEVKSIEALVGKIAVYLKTEVSAEL